MVDPGEPIARGDKQLDRILGFFPAWRLKPHSFLQLIPAFSD